MSTPYLSDQLHLILPTKHRLRGDAVSEYADGLTKPLLICHGMQDNNVFFQDTVRLAQRLIELEKDFEVMVYPVQAHTVQTEASRYDLFRREAAFFDEKLRGIHR